MNKTRERILLLLLGGLAFGYSVTPGKQRMVLKTISREWAKLGTKELNEGIKYLYRLDYIDKEAGGKSFFNLVLTKKGKFKSLDCQLDNLKSKKTEWDGKWRMVAFDIPDKYKTGRDALRRKLGSIGFCKLQESIFITPIDCIKEMKLLVDFFELEKYVRFGILESVDNEEYLKKLFKLS